MIDVVGHFGSRLSYATVADQVARGLADRGVLGSVTNLDDKFIDDRTSATANDRGKKVILISDARDYLVEALVAAYGYENVAIFVCPNTDRLSDERARACCSVGRIYTPSSWCRRAIYGALDTMSLLGVDSLFSTGCNDPDKPSVIVMPLGVDSPFSTGWNDPDKRPAPAPGRLRMLHVTTDTFWPGRKGTEELLGAWKLAEMNRLATLAIHCLPQLYPTLYQAIGDLDLLDRVKLIAAPQRGTTPQELFELIAQHDLLIAPSRSEGFGLMPLSALVSGTPVLTTAGTGQDEYLTDVDDAGEPVLGGWLQVPTLGTGALSGEYGDAPAVRVDQLAFALVAGRRLYDELLFGVKRNKKVQTAWSWWSRRAEWARDLAEWEAAS